MSSESFAFIIFGGTGDLARRKLVPALRQLASAGYMPERYAVLGVARKEMTDEEYRSLLDGQQPDQSPLRRHLSYQAGDIGNKDSYDKLEQRVKELESSAQLSGNRLFYLAVAPEFFLPILQHLGAAGMLQPRSDETWVRVIIEKPFGNDLESAKILNGEIRKLLHEEQVYRIDHYLGKETVQNILTFRFSNSLFEPLFNRTHVESILITVAESDGIEGRGGYYDKAGALRDMIQNHVLQLLCLITMEPPASFDAQSIRDEKVKVLRALPPMGLHRVAEDTVRGQYNGYREEEGVSPASTTESYVALRTTIENWRWSDVPIILRTGKRMDKRWSEIVVRFNEPPLCLLRQFAECPPNPNILVFRIQPNEGISLSFGVKTPGNSMAVQDVKMDFSYGEAFEGRLPEAYERLLLDALRGDQSLFTRSDEVEYAWKFITDILNAWKKLPSPEFPNYEPGSDGPAEANRLLNPSQSRRQ